MRAHRHACSLVTHIDLADVSSQEVRHKTNIQLLGKSMHYVPGSETRKGTGRMPAEEEVPVTQLVSLAREEVTQRNLSHTGFRVTVLRPPCASCAMNEARPAHGHHTCMYPYLHPSPLLPDPNNSQRDVPRRIQLPPASRRSLLGCGWRYVFGFSPRCFARPDGIALVRANLPRRGHAGHCRGVPHPQQARVAGWDGKHRRHARDGVEQVGGGGGSSPRKE